MTITLELTPEQEAKLRDNARAAGAEPAEYLSRLLDQAPPVATGLLPGESLLDALKRVGYIGSFASTPRADGRPWSEVEGFE
jgi:hypothetical protein